MSQRSLYDILGVSHDAEVIVIRAAYKALAQRYHPDKWMGDKEDATRIMAELNHAYSLLSDPGRRRKYDERVKPSVNAKQNPVSSEGAHSNEFNREEKVSGRSLHKNLWYVLADFKKTTQTERDRIKSTWIMGIVLFALAMTFGLIFA